MSFERTVRGGATGWAPAHAKDWKTGVLVGQEPCVVIETRGHFVQGIRRT